MEKCYSNDFIRVRPWGKMGDRKNDGYLCSKKILFQVYAPNIMTAYEATKKIDEDFNGALPYWEEYIDQWTFVHNSREGIGPEITKKILELRKQNSPKKIETWGYENLRKTVFSLCDEDIVSLFGPAPSQGDIRNVDFEQIKYVLEYVAKKDPSDFPDLRPVPKNKLKANGLSESVEILLLAGMKKVNLVKSYFSKCANPLLGDQISESFNSKYKELKEKGIPPDYIFMKLQEFAGGAQRNSPEHEAAILAVLAHLFENCDIFERPDRELI